MSTRPTLFAVFLQTTGKRQTRSLKAIRHIIRNAFPSFASQIVVVDNAITIPTEEQLGENAVLINGDNSCREFSGMARGISWLEQSQTVHPESAILLANDTFLDDPAVNQFLGLSSRKALTNLDANRILGSVDRFARPMNVLGLPMERWVKSSFMVCLYRVLEQIKPLVVPITDGEFFSENPQEIFRPGAPISEPYQRFITAFLQGKPNETLWKWDSANPFSDEMASVLRLKAKAILCEHHLSAKATRLGFGLHDLSHPKLPSKKLRARARRYLYHTGAWRLIPMFRQRFERTSAKPRPDLPNHP